MFKVSISLLLFYLLPDKVIAQHDSVFTLPYSEQYKVFDSIAQDIFTESGINKAKKEIQRYYEVALQKEDERSILMVEIILLRLKLGTDKMEDALKFAEGLRAKARRLKSPANEARCHIELCYYYFSKSKQYNEAFEEGLKAYEIYKNIPFKEFDRYYLIYSLGMMYYQFYDYENALKFSNEAFLLAGKRTETGVYAKDDVYLYACDLNGMIYQRTGRYDSAFYYFHLLPDIALAIFKNNKQLINAWTGIAKGNMGNNWYLQNQFEKAIPLLEEGTELTYENKLFDNSALFAAHLAAIYISQKKLAHAEKYINIALRSAYGHYDDRNYYTVYKTLSDYNRANGNIQFALLYLDSALVYKENLDKKVNVSLKVKSELDVMQQRREIEKENFNEKIKSQGRLTFYALLGLVVMLLLTVAIFRSLMVNRRNNKIITWQNQQMEGSLREKEVLLKEIHHRVKNNLQVISSLLEMHQRKISEPQLQQSYNEARSHVQSIGLIHQNLYRNDNLAAIDFCSFAEDLYKQVNSVFNHAKKEVCLQSDIENIHLDIDTAVPLGLILNELLTNSFKYALGNGKMEIGIAITKDKTKENYRMMYHDNGPGMPEDVLQKQSMSLGISVIKDLTRQIGGKITYRKDKGSGFLLHFKSLKRRKEID